jgi:hypothetical protein
METRNQLISKVLAGIGLDRLGTAVSSKRIQTGTRLNPLTIYPSDSGVQCRRAFTLQYPTVFVNDSSFPACSSRCRLRLEVHLPGGMDTSDCL